MNFLHRGPQMRISFLVLLVAAAPALAAEESALQLLFGRETHGLSLPDQQAIFNALALKVAPDSQQFIDATCNLPASVDVQFLELNGDSVPEVLVVYGNTCMSGNAGTSVALFIKTGGKYVNNLGFPGADVTPLATRHLGYSDILIGGPGYCFPVWRWNGREYEFLRQEPQSAGGCNGR